jgi:hypothetical protein
MASDDDDDFDGGIDDPAKRDYSTVDGTIIPAHESNNPEKKSEVKKLCRRLKILRETIAYKEDERQYMDQMMLDLAYSESLPTEFCYYRHQQLERLYQHEERLVRDLASLGYDASRETERAREEHRTDEMNEEVDLDDDDDDIDYIG